MIVYIHKKPLHPYAVISRFEDKVLKSGLDKRSDDLLKPSFRLVDLDCRLFEQVDVLESAVQHRFGYSADARAAVQG